MIAAGVIEHDEFAVEHEAWRQESEHVLEPFHVVTVAGDQLATNSVGGGAEAVELGLEQLVGMIERLCPRDRIDQWQHAGGAIVRACAIKPEDNNAILPNCNNLS